MDHFQEIYQKKAADYHRMIDAEDVDGKLLPALQTVSPLQGKRVLDIGSGSGRIPLLLTPLACEVVALELSRAMLREQRLRMAEQGFVHKHIQADMRCLPLANHNFDVAIAGWAIGHLCAWYKDSWQQEMTTIIEEMCRVTVAGGMLLILETLSTGSYTPAPPTKGLADYYAWLENTWGFQRQTIQTDYQFASVEEAVQRTEFFFGEELAKKIKQNQWARVPEWTGVWSRPA